MDHRAVIVVGAIGGSVVGILGGVVGTYFSIKNTHGPRERAFMVQVSAVGWVIAITFLVALGLTPFPYRGLWWVPYGLVVPWAIRAGNRRQDQIRREETLDS